MDKLTIAETCEVLRVSRWTLLRFVKDGHLAAAKQDPSRRNGAVRIAKADLRKHLARSIQSGQTDPKEDLMASDTLPRLLTLKEVATRTGLELKSLQVGCRKGRFTHVLSPSGKRYMTEQQVSAMVADLTRSGGPVPAADPEAATRARVNRASTRAPRARKPAAA